MVLIRKCLLKHTSKTEPLMEPRNKWIKMCLGRGYLYGEVTTGGSGPGRQRAQRYLVTQKFLQYVQKPLTKLTKILNQAGTKVSGHPKCLPGCSRTTDNIDKTIC
jgi:hypothetical protein